MSPPSPWLAALRQFVRTDLPLWHMKAAFRVLAFVLVLAACGDASGPRSIEGVYQLAAIGGRPVPTSIDGLTCTVWYQEATLAFPARNRGRLIFYRTFAQDRCTEPFEVEQVQASYALDEDSIFVTFDPPHTHLHQNAGRGALLDGRATIMLPIADLLPSTFVFRRQ
jgi:hypothetical protein